MDLKHQRVIDKFIAHSKRINSSHVYENDGLLLTAGDDCVAKIWRLWRATSDPDGTAVI